MTTATVEHFVLPDIQGDRRTAQRGEDIPIKDPGRERGVKVEARTPAASR